MTYIERKYREFYATHGYIPRCFEPYNCRAVVGVVPTITASSNCSYSNAGTVLVVEDDRTDKRT